jgi:CTP:phosphocholine cytidylyltransferase-like protein
MPQSIDWLERGFKMDIFPDTFPANASVNITIIYHHSYPPAFNKYTLVTPNYEIESTHQPSGTAVIVHLKHNVMHRDNNASFHLIHQHDDNTVTSSAIENISKYFISFKVDSFSCCCVMCSNCTIKYGASFYARKTSSHVQVQVVLNSFKDKMKDNKYSKWIKEPISPLEIHHNVTVTTEVELEPSGYGCLTKLEKHSYTMIIDDDPKEEFSFHFKWNSSCPWWDLWSSQKSSTWIDVHIKDNKPTTAMIFLESK